MTSIFFAWPRCLSSTFSSLMPRSSRQQRPPGEDGDVAQHRLAAIAEARRLDGAHVQHAAQPVDDERREGLALDVFGDDQQRLARMGHLFQHGNEVAEAGNLLLVDQDQAVFQHARHVLGIVDEIGRNIPLVELHPFGEFERGRAPFALFDRDHAVAAHALHRVGNQVPDRLIVVGRDRADLGDLRLGADRLRGFLNVLDGGLDGLVDPAANDHGV